MKSTDDQGLIPVIVASEADSTYIRTIPIAQAAAGDGSVSLDLGLPPECAISVAAGGKRPELKDMNGIWNLFSRAIQSLQAYRGVYNASFASAIGGYPKYALVSDSSGNFWVSTVDQNTTTPGETDAFWNSLFSGYATESWANGKFQPLGDYVKTLPSDGTYAPVLTIQHKNTDGTLAVRYEEDGSGFAYFQPAGDYAIKADLSDKLKVPGATSPWIQSTVASFNSSDGANGTVIALGTAYQNRCLFAFGNDVGNGAHSFGTEIIDAGHVRIFGKTGGNFINSVMNLITIGY